MSYGFPVPMQLFDTLAGRGCAAKTTFKASFKEAIKMRFSQNSGNTELIRWWLIAIISGHPRRRGQKGLENNRMHRICDRN
jgi:hypothetical protein